MTSTQGFSDYGPQMFGLPAFISQLLSSQQMIPILSSLAEQFMPEGVRVKADEEGIWIGSSEAFEKEDEKPLNSKELYELRQLAGRFERAGSIGSNRVEEEAFRWELHEEMMEEEPKREGKGEGKGSFEDWCECELGTKKPWKGAGTSKKAFKRWCKGQCGGMKPWKVFD
jgi:hypothetical protein